MSIAFTRRGWGVLFWAIAVGTSWFVVGLRDVWYLAAFLAALVLISAVMVSVIGISARFRIRLTTPDPTPRAGEAVPITAQIRQLLPVSLTVELQWRAAEDQYTSVASITRRRPAEVQWTWRGASRGPQTVRISRLHLTDPLGLVRCSRVPSAQMELLVLPARCEELADVLGAGAELPGADEQLVAREPIAASGTPGGAVRDYRAGDALRHIHWKQSARQVKLLTNLPEPQDSPERSLLLVTEYAEYVSRAGFEYAVSATATLAEQWIQEGFRVRLQQGDDPAEIFTDQGQLLTHLAHSQRRRHAPERPFPSSDGRAGVVVTGSPSAAFIQQIADTNSSGTLLVSGEPKAAPPPHWRIVTIPRHPAKSSDV